MKPKATNAKKLIIAVGLPGSGKSTHLKQQAKKIGAAYVCPDDVRQELLGDAGDTSQDARVWQSVHERIAKGLERGSVIIDGIGIDPEFRRRDIARYRGLADQVIVFYFNTPLNICLERNQRRERRVPEARIREMHRQLIAHPPDVGEGFDEIVIIDANQKIE